MNLQEKMLSTGPTYDLLARDNLSLTVLLTPRLQCRSWYIPHKFLQCKDQHQVADTIFQENSCTVAIC